MNIHIEGRYKSISDLKWSDVPPFAVITGVNGTGKSQLLEIIPLSHGAGLGMAGYPEPRLPPDPLARIEGASFGTGQVFHSYGEWP